MAEQEPKPMTDLETLAHNLDLWVEDAKQHNSEYVPVHRKTLAQMNDHLRELSRLQAGGQGVEQHGVCNNADCAWGGPLSECRALGSIQPLCPVCGETVEPCGAHPPAAPACRSQSAESDAQAGLISTGETQQPAAPALVPLPDYAAYAVIDSMGWDLDDVEKDDMLALIRKAEARLGINGLTVGDGGRV